MRNRCDLTEIFSTFLQFQAERADGWIPDPRLRRNMQKRLAGQSEVERSEVGRSEVGRSENFWIVYWHQRWAARACKLAEDHLSAYLQEPCYWAALKAASNFTSQIYSLPDYFQIGMLKLRRVLKGFDRSRSSSLRDYANLVFQSAIKDILRQHREADLCTDWALLRKLSIKRFTEALTAAGVSEEQTARYRLTWTCFQTTYVPKQATSTRQLAKPDRPTWEAIAQLYNTERLSQLPPSEPSQSPEILERWLADCARWARSHLHPQVVSLNQPKQLGADAGEWQDDLSDGDDRTPLEEAIAVEEVRDRETQQQEINAALHRAINEADVQTQELLKLYYSQTFTQQQIAQQLGIQQYAVSRQLARARKTLLKFLACWVRDEKGVTLDRDTVESMGGVVEEWLQKHYGEQSDNA